MASVGSNQYPGGHVEYAFKMFATTAAPIKCHLVAPNVTECILTKLPSTKLDDPAWTVQIHFGPVNSIDEVDAAGESVKDELFDRLTLATGIKVFDIRKSGHGLVPRPGGGMTAHLMMGRSTVSATLTTPNPPIQGHRLQAIQDVLARVINPNAIVPMSLFRSALATDDAVAQFLICFLVLLELSNQKQDGVDTLIQSFAPTTPFTPSPHRAGAQESIYTRLRNEVSHRGNVKPETVRNEIQTHLDAFKSIVKQAIEKIA